MASLFFVPKPKENTCVYEIFFVNLLPFNLKII